MKITALLLLLLILELHFSFAQQPKKPARYPLERRQEKLAMSSPGDLSLRTYTHLKKEMLSIRQNPVPREYRKMKQSYQARKKR